ncbi:MAG TPA: ATPase, T2SS/T4P/T4SS family [Acidimicrobiia bacterium]|nr:ATPase, T2SS/T4P/T4SS family [Acidimicrobiia bacterium]
MTALVEIRSSDRERVARAVHARLLAAPGAVATDHGHLRAQLSALVSEEAPLLDARASAQLVDRLVQEVAGLGPLEPLLADPDVTEIMLNGAGRAYVERRGRIEPVVLALGADDIVRFTQRVIAPLGLRWDRSAPIVDARLADGSRLHGVLAPLAPDGPCVTIRRFAVRPATVAEFGVDERAGTLLAAMVAARWNIVVAGATSAGKTTLVNTLAAHLDPALRIVTIEETAELRLPHPHVVRLEGRPGNGEGAGAVSVRDLVRAALRMRPDRIVVGEVRGVEAVDLLQALATGHDGSLSTIHAGDPPSALRRLETLALMADVGLPLDAVRAQIAAAIDAVIVVARSSAGAREMVAVHEVVADPTAPTTTRPLLRRANGELERCGDPVRPARDPAVDLALSWTR